MRRVVVLGMMAKTPVPGVVWQTLHYLLGLRSLGLEPYYVEAHARTPSMLMAQPTDDGGARAAHFIDTVLRRFGLGDRWAYQALHGDGRTYGLSERDLIRLYREAELILNLHGGTEPRTELAATGRLVYIETDPVQLQIELHNGLQSSIDFLDQHQAWFTFAENLGTDVCGLPVCERYPFQPTRQPVMLDLWDSGRAPAGGSFTTIANWRQRWRSVQYGGRVYGWSKDVEWQKVLDLPARTGARFDIALSGYEESDKKHLEARGWCVSHALDLDIDRYRDFIVSSLAEFTVAKEQNVAFSTGWFSDRSATYLAAGRPVVTQDTGFGQTLPTGDGLFAYTDADEAAAAVASIQADPVRHASRAHSIAREYFAAERVLADLLSHCDVAIRSRTMTDQRPTPLSRRTGRHRLGPGSSVLALIPYFRCEEWLEDCLESMVQQTRPLDGIVVIDDASGDPPLRILQRFPQVTLLQADRNSGPYRLVQQVIEDTRYDAYLFQDADDWSAPDRLELLLRYAERTGAELIGTQEVRVFCDEAEVTPISWPLDVHAPFEAKPTAFPLLHPTSLVSRDLVMELGGFAAGLRFSGDAEFLRRARFVCHVTNIPHHSYYRRIREGSLTTAPETGLQSPERKRVMEMLWERARSNAERAADGQELDLAPIASAPPVSLSHLAGPALAGERDSGTASLATSATGPGTAFAGSGGPVFVVGADRSGVSALACALGQHPALSHLVNGGWLAELAEGLAGEPANGSTIGGGVSELASRLPGRWVDGSWENTFAIAPLAKLFPTARFIHLVRDVDTAVAVMVDPPMGSAGATGGTQVPERVRTKLAKRDAVTRWLSATRACADGERSLDADRFLRVSFDVMMDSPEHVLRQCLDFVGEPYARECLRPLRGMRARKLEAGTVIGDGSTSEDEAAAAALSERLLDTPDSLAAARSCIRRFSRLATSEMLTAHVPSGSVVAVVSRGDDELLRTEHCRAIHFPQDKEGNWLGYHPIDDREAICALDRARDAGATHLFVPGTSRWWLDHYAELRALLDRRDTCVVDSETGTLFELAAAGSSRGRVVLVTDHFPKFSETFFVHEFTGLLERGWDVHILCNRSNKDQWPFFPELADELEAGERIHVIHDLDAQLAELRPDLIHFGYGTLARGHMHLGETVGAKVVVSFRGYDINYFGLDDPDCYVDVWSAADTLHLVSTDIWQRAKRRGCPPDIPHRVITDAVVVDEFTNVQRDGGTLGTQHRPLRAVGVGRLHWKKGYEHALRAVRMLLDRGIDVQYRVVGEGNDREAITFAIHDLGLEDHVELLGARAADDVRDSLAWADVFLHAAVSEGFCVSVIEAQASGLPVVCTDADGLAENVAHRVSGIVVPRRDPGALADALEELAAQPALRESMGAAARERAEHNFDLSGQLDALEAMYRDVLATRAPAQAVSGSVEAMEQELLALEVRREALAKEVRAIRVTQRTREDIDRLLPSDATVLVVSRGDERLLDVGGRAGWHFPQAEDGVYAGHHPADSDTAILHLETLRSQGADHLVIPATSAWWLEHYGDFRRYLDDRYSLVSSDPDRCVIYALGHPSQMPVDGVSSTALEAA
jgi:glycosyltransferase involved in cell wall biosynthesis